MAGIHQIESVQPPMILFFRLAYIDILLLRYDCMLTALEQRLMLDKSSVSGTTDGRVVLKRLVFCV
jgi:hypothetical protein